MKEFKLSCLVVGVTIVMTILMTNVMTVLMVMTIGDVQLNCSADEGVQVVVSGGVMIIFMTILMVM